MGTEERRARSSATIDHRGVEEVFSRYVPEHCASSIIRLSEKGSARKLETMHNRQTPGDIGSSGLIVMGSSGRRDGKSR